jgi:heme exporter protein A
MPERSAIGQAPNDAAAPAVLRLTDAACARGGRVLWRGLNLALAPGGLIHITGANGCGKSSLLRVAAGLLAPAHGTVVCHADGGLVDEAHALDPDVPLSAALSFWAALAQRPQSIDAAITATGIAHLVDVPPRLFSTGQRKRAALARLLVEQRTLWLLDEPANGLDDDGVAMLGRLIAAHRAAGGAVLLASHQPLDLAPDATIALAELRP